MPIAQGHVSWRKISDLLRVLVPIPTYKILILELVLVVSINTFECSFHPFVKQIRIWADKCSSMSKYVCNSKELVI